MQTSNQAVAPLSPAQRARVDALLDDMFDLPDAERIANLRARSIEDSAVLAEVESLLRSASASICSAFYPARHARYLLHPVGICWRAVSLITLTIL